MNKTFLICFFICVSLACNNYCNGHGKCGSGDKCACFMGWGGADCSLRSCPYDDAFVDLPLGDINHDGAVSKDDAKDEWRPNGGISENLDGYVTKTRAHRYAECSNAGLCNRNTGECECFPGYEGSACQRRGCPTAVENAVCSGHGSCLTSTTIIHDDASTTDKYYGWESEKFMSCLCDKGWEGIDCNLRKCPKGVDPIEGTVNEFTYTYPSTPSTSTLPTTSSYFKIEYDGIIYQTTEIGATSPTCDSGKIKDTSILSQYTESVRRILSNTVSGFSSVSVKVECDTNNIKMILSLPPTRREVFKGSKVTVCSDVACSSGTDLTKSPLDNTTTKEYLCSRRGNCNSDTGECDCFPGYGGEACQNQRSIAL